MSVSEFDAFRIFEADGKVEGRIVKATLDELSEGESSQAEMFNPPSPKELGLPTTQPVQVPVAMINQEQRVEVPVGAYSSELCPECSSGLAHIEGCEKCFNCGYSKC